MDLWTSACRWLRPPTHVMLALTQRVQPSIMIPGKAGNVGSASMPAGTSALS